MCVASEVYVLDHVLGSGGLSRGRDRGWLICELGWNGYYVGFVSVF